MIEKPKRKPLEKRKRDGGISFVVPFSLSDCIRRILDTKRPYINMSHRGVHPTVEKVEDGIYRFQISILYSVRPSTYPWLRLDGYLNEIDEGSTMIAGRVRIGWLNLMVSVFITVGVIGGLAQYSPEPIGLVVNILLIAYWVWFTAKLYFDRKELIQQLYRVMSDEALLQVSEEIQNGEADSGQDSARRGSLPPDRAVSTQRKPPV